MASDYDRAVLFRWIALDKANEDTVKYLEHAIESAPSVIERNSVATLLAYDLEGRGNTPRAIQTLEKCIALQPEESCLWVILGSIYAKHSEFDRAFMCFDEALKPEMNNSESIGFILFERMRVAVLAKNKELAESSLQAFMNIAEDCPHFGEFLLPDLIAMDLDQQLLDHYAKRCKTAQRSKINTPVN